MCLPVFFSEKLYVGQAWLKQISWTCVSLSWRNFNKPSPVGVGLNEASLVKPDLSLFVKRAEQSWKLHGGFRNCLLNLKRTMVGKARSSNFTLSEKLDLLKLVKPYVKILEEHTNKHSVIVEKNIKFRHVCLADRLKLHCSITLIKTKEELFCAVCLQIQ